jgi:hypothetical protein
MDMRVAIIDCFSGASGDMIVSSLFGITLTEEDLRKVISSFHLDIDFEVKKVKKSGIDARKIDVRETKVERTFKEVTNKFSKVSDPELREAVPDAMRIFERIAQAEAEVHGHENYEDALFHEVGSDDAIFDVVSATLGLNRLKKDGYRIYTTPINLGSGEVVSHHGRYPVPPPAVTEIIKNSNLEVYYSDMNEGELLTPTGAAILAHFSEGSFKYPFSVENINYGAGSKELKRPNVLRLILGKSKFHDRIVVLETNVDDASGEIIGNAINILSKLCLDVSAIPFFGKKNRPGYILKAICKSEDIEKVSKTMMMETGSIGVRVIPVYHRLRAFREQKKVDVLIEGRKFSISVKVSYPERKIIKPEFDDVKKIAEELNLPLPEVYSKVISELTEMEQ